MSMRYRDTFPVRLAPAKFGVHGSIVARRRLWALSMDAVLVVIGCAAFALMLFGAYYR